MNIKKKILFADHQKFINWFDGFIYFLVVINLLALCANTFEELKGYGPLFHFLEVLLTVAFTIEYIIRCILAFIKGKLIKYVTSLLGIVDLLSILPYFLPIGTFRHTSILKILRLFRLLTMFKMYRYSEHVKTVFDVIYHKRGDLIATFLAIFFVVIFCSYAMYVLEHEVQPQKFRNILDGLWWGIGTIATVGYGDVIPMSFGGKLISSFLSLLGVGLVAIPSAILSAGFIELQNDKRARRNKNNELP